ncbi:unnamed protein product [Chondrus crispus]|uniref:Uncharacterized protein n=1 Tax=Chondrus crispus TaxID=2769 RepID=R7Q916_CHOCR|nr:unnamed protein product [Chondrus crispus]CDF34308.1 unnamed protein product [Chondrus crispus]|eukprot:XP_005714127.1 unnamed protein product [Chondrus crispus]
MTLETNKTIVGDCPDLRLLSLKYWAHIIGGIAHQR